MNISINNIAFNGTLKFKNENGKSINIDTKDIEEIGCIDDYDLFIKTNHDRGFDVPKGRYRKETFIIRHHQNEKGYNQLLRMYDIASNNNVILNVDHAIIQDKNLDNYA